MSIYVKDGILHVSGAQDKIRQKGQERPAFLNNYTMIDIETTGLSTYRDRITELGAVRVRNSKVVAHFSCLVKFPNNNRVPAFITRLNGITEKQILAEGVPAAQAMQNFRDFIAADPIAGYNVNFDLNFLYDLSEKMGLPRLNNDYVDVLRLAKVYYPHSRHNRLIDCMKRAGIAQVEQHHGLADSLDTIKVYQDLRRNYTKELLAQAQASLKNVNLLAKKMDYRQLGRRNPVQEKKIVVAGHLHADPSEIKTMINNMGGILTVTVAADTNYLLIGDHDFFNKSNTELNAARKLIKNGAKIKRLSESFFLNMIAEWARQ